MKDTTQIVVLSHTFCERIGILDTILELALQLALLDGTHGLCSSCKNGKAEQHQELLVRKSSPCSPCFMHPKTQATAKKDLDNGEDLGPPAENEDPGAGQQLACP